MLLLFSKNYAHMKDCHKDYLTVKKRIVISSFIKAVTGINPNGVKISNMSLNLFFRIFQNMSANLKGPSVNNELYYVWYTERL